MTKGKRKWLTWLVSGAAFVTVVGVAGCANHTKTSGGNTAAPVASGEPAPTSAADRFNFGSDPRSEAVPPKVNVFGEFEGEQRTVIRAPRSGGEAAGFQQHTYIDEGFDGEVCVDPKGQCSCSPARGIPSTPTSTCRRLTGSR